MSDLVIARLGRTSANPVGWATFAGARLVESGHAENGAALFETLQRVAGGARIAAVLPGEQVAMRAFASPPRSPVKFASAAGLLLEDELAQPVDGCHVATHRMEDAGRVYAVDLHVMRRWVDLFSEKGFPLAAALPDFECLGGTRERPILFLENDRIVASFGDRAFAAETDIALPAIEALLAEQPDAEVGVYGEPARSPAHSGGRYDRIGEANDEALLCAAAQTIESGASINLLQGAFRPRRRRVVELSRWRRPAIAAGIFAVALLAFAVADGFRTKRIAERYAQEARRLHDEYFPDAASADPRSHARSVLAGSGASFLALSDRLGRAVADNESVAIDRIRFDEARGQLVFSIRSVSDADIASFREALSAYGVTTAETGGYRRAGAYWVGEMTARL